MMSGTTGVRFEWLNASSSVGGSGQSLDRANVPRGTSFSSGRIWLGMIVVLELRGKGRPRRALEKHRLTVLQCTL